MKIQELFNRLWFRLNNRVIHLKPSGKVRGNVLLSYITLPFLNTDPAILNTHTNRWECLEMAKIFLDLGYAVDVIDFENTSFKPKKSYRYFIDVGTNMERIGPELGKTCIKIYHATGAYWSFQNKAEEERLLDIQKRKGLKLIPRRLVPATHATEVADVITLIGNEFTKSTYSHVDKPIRCIPISTTHLFPSPVNKDIEKARKNFIWFGGAGAVHKGLDLVLEAFAAMPEYSLTVYGKPSNEDDFVHAYDKELFHTPNIRMNGWVDPASPAFAQTVDHSLAIIYPSCAEGTAGSVVLAMHTGLIPIVSRETGVDVGDFGMLLKANTTEEVQASVRSLSSEPYTKLTQRAVDAWRYAQATYTRPHFETAYRAVIEELESTQPQQLINHA